MKIIYAGVMGGENGFTAAMRSVCGEFVDIPMSDVNNALMGLKSADIAFLQPQDGSISIQALQHLKNIGAWVCGWSGDVRVRIPDFYFEYAKYIDLTCFSNMNDVRTMRSLGYDAEFLQIGGDPKIYYPDENVIKDVDIVFCGNTFGHFPLSRMRVDMVRELKKTYGDRFKAFGSGQPDGALNNQKDEADMYRRAKIGINLSHFDYERYTSDRMMRMLLSGICVLSHRYKGIEIDFERGAHLSTWKDIDELKQQIDTHLGAENWIDFLGKQGQELALKEYTFSKMAKNILQLYNEYKK